MCESHIVIQSEKKKVNVKEQFLHWQRVKGSKLATYIKSLFVCSFFFPDKQIK